MSNITLYDSEYITVEYWPDEKLIYHVVHQPLTDHVEIFKEALNSGTEALEKHKVQKWLSDDRKNGPLSNEGNNWAFGDWQPRTMEAGWKYWATVVPQDLAAAGTLLPVINHLHEIGLRMMVFVDVQEALKWLDGIEKW